MSEPTETSSSEKTQELAESVGRGAGTILFVGIFLFGTAIQALGIFIAFFEVGWGEMPMLSGPPLVVEVGVGHGRVGGDLQAP